MLVKQQYTMRSTTIKNGLLSKKNINNNVSTEYNVYLAVNDSVVINPTLTLCCLSNHKNLMILR